MAFLLPLLLIHRMQAHFLFSFEILIVMPDIFSHLLKFNLHLFYLLFKISPNFLNSLGGMLATLDCFRIRFCLQKCLFLKVLDFPIKMLLDNVRIFIYPLQFSSASLFKLKQQQNFIFEPFDDRVNHFDYALLEVFEKIFIEGFISDS